MSERKGSAFGIGLGNGLKVAFFAIVGFWFVLAVGTIADYSGECIGPGFGGFLGGGGECSLPEFVLTSMIFYVGVSLLFLPLYLVVFVVAGLAGGIINQMKEDGNVESPD